MIRTWLMVLFLAAGMAVPAVADEGAPSELKEAFRVLRSLRPMQENQAYTVPVAGQEETGRKERFLRWRTVAEVLASGLASGCGDYAEAFIALVRGGDDAVSDLTDTASAGWVSHVGLRSACSRPMLYHFEERIREQGKASPGG